MLRLTSNQRRWWEFLVTMLEREIKSKYKVSILGVFWVILSPVIQMVAIGFIFIFFTSLKTESYLLYLFSGIVVWNFFSSSVIRCTPSIISERFLLKKAVFPKEVIIVSIVLVNLMQMLISTILMIIAAVFLGITFSVFNLIFFCLSILFLFLFVLGCCFIFSALNVKYRDINFVVNFLVPIWFYVTPVIYTVSVLPKIISSLLYINPLTSLLEFFRLSVLNWSIWDYKLMFIGLVMSLVIFIVGVYIFKKESRKFDDWI